MNTQYAMQHADCIHSTKVNTTLNTQYAMQHKCNATQIQCNTNGQFVIRFAEFLTAAPLSTSLSMDDNDKKLCLQDYKSI